MMMKMDRENRAKQFAPFSALRGLEELIHAEERIWVEKRELSEEAKEELNDKLSQIQQGDTVKAEYYRNGAYHLCAGTVEKISSQGKYMIVEEIKIEFDRLFTLEL